MALSEVLMGKRGLLASRQANLAGLVITCGLFLPAPAFASAEVRLDREFLAGLIEKIPQAPFQKAGQYHGSARGFHLASIDPEARRLVVTCEVVGEFRAPIAGALRRAVTPPGTGGLPQLPPATSATSTPKGSPNSVGPLASLPLDRESTRGWQGFTFDVRVAIHVEPGGVDGSPRFKVDVEEVKRRELDGVAGALALVLGRHFDSIVTQLADGKAALLSEKVNNQIRAKLAAFQDYGVLCGIGYEKERLTLRFDVTRYQADGIAGYVFPADAPRPGSVPLYRWVRPRINDHFYTTASGPPAGHPYYVYETVACHVLDHPEPGTVPLHRWRGRMEWFYTSAPDGEGVASRGFHPQEIACYVYSSAAPGTVPLYRFTDPRGGLHFYSTHPHAEFLK